MLGPLWDAQTQGPVSSSSGSVSDKGNDTSIQITSIKLVHPKGSQPGCSLEGLMLKLKLQYFGHLMRRADLLEKTLMLGKIEGRRRRG